MATAAINGMIEEEAEQTLFLDGPTIEEEEGGDARWVWYRLGEVPDGDISLYEAKLLAAPGFPAWKRFRYCSINRLRPLSQTLFHPRSPYFY